MSEISEDRVALKILMRCRYGSSIASSVSGSSEAKDLDGWPAIGVGASCSISRYLPPCSHRSKVML